MEKYVYHYTSLDALRGIIGEKLCMWATQYDHLNDPSEQIWAEKRIYNAIQNTHLYKGDNIENLRKWFNNNSYIISLCKKRDYRNMWRLYCGDGRGVCLVLKRKILEKTSLHNMVENPEDQFDIMENVRYADDNHIDDAIKELMKRKAFYNVDEEDASRWMRIPAFIKNSDFIIENEIRYVRLRSVESIRVSYNHENNDMDIIPKMNNHNIKYRMRGTELVPYIEILFPASALHEIIVGYETHQETVKTYIESLMEPFNELYKDVLITPSRLFSTKQKELKSL